MNQEVTSPDFWSDYKVEVGHRVDNVLNLHDIQSKDGDHIADPFLAPGDLEPAPRLISYAPYYEPRYVNLEVERIWRKEWQIACREEDIPNVGDRVSYDIVHDSYIVIRTAANTFKAFHNACRHRGRKLCDGKDSGDLRCPFHGWTFSNDGDLKWVPYDQEFPNLDRSRYGLIPVQCESWGGNVFINPDRSAPPLLESVGPLAAHFRKYPQEGRYTALRILVQCQCNWKTAQEAFMEAYHVVQTHSDGMPMFGSASTQVDVWSEGRGFVSRLATPGMTTDAYVTGMVTARQGLELFCNAYSLPFPPDGRGEDLVDARAYIAEKSCERLQDLTGNDYSDEPVSYWLDMAKYFMFPNFHPWWGENLPWWYNFTPYGSDPDRSIMELRVLVPIPASGERPPVPDALVIGFGERATPTHPELGILAHLIDQDLYNMEAVQKGMRAAPAGADFATTSVYQEKKVRRFHEIYDEMLGLDGDD